jgi:hypothetical protein
MFRKILPIPLILLLVLAGCSTRLLSVYDPVTDSEITRLQKEVDSYLALVQKDVETDGSPPVNEKFYADFKADVRALLARAEQIELNEPTVDQLEILDDAVDNLLKYHRLGFDLPEEVILWRDSFDSIFRAILKLEIAKKREG